MSKLNSILFCFAETFQTITNVKTEFKFVLFFRNQLCHQYEKLAVSTIASDEEDAKYLAKRKMLGNIKFIGELGKLQIIQDFILHRLVIVFWKEVFTATMTIFVAIYF